MTMSQGISYCKDIIWAGAHFYTSGQLTTHEQDGREFLHVGLVARERLKLLATQLGKTFPGLITHRIGWLPCLLGVFLQFTYGKADHYLRKKESERTVLFTALSRMIKETARYQTTYTNTIINVACVVSYVAIIAFGMPVSGMIGLAGVFLIQLKRTNNLSITVDHCLEPLVLAARMGADVLTPFSLFDRLRQGYRYFDKWTHLLLKKGVAKQYFSKEVANPLPQTHLVKDCHRLRTSFHWEQVKNYVRSNENFSVNRSHLFSRDFRYLSDELIARAEEVSVHELFEKVEAKIREKEMKMVEWGKEISVLDSEGWVNFRMKAKENCFSDQGVANIDTFNLLMKNFLISLLEERTSDLPKTDDETFLEVMKRERFGAMVSELVEGGAGCTRALTRDLKVILQPGHKDYKWAVHYLLAHQRGEIIMKFLRIEDAWLRGWSNNIVSADLVGGVEDVHLQDYVQIRFWHRFRPYAAERNRELKERNFLEIVLINLLCRLEGWKRDLCECLLFGKYVLSGLAHFEMVAFVIGLFPYINNLYSKVALCDNFYDEYTVKSIVDEVYSAIQAGDTGVPYLYDEKTKELKEVMQISLQAVSEWIQDMGSHKEFTGMLAGNEGGRWLERPNLLTKDAVRLLLWDMGILTPISWGSAGE